LDKLLLR